MIISEMHLSSCFSSGSYSSNPTINDRTAVTANLNIWKTNEAEFIYNWSDKLCLQSGETFYSIHFVL